MLELADDRCVRPIQDQVSVVQVQNIGAAAARSDVNCIDISDSEPEAETGKSDKPKPAGRS